MTDARMSPFNRMPNIIWLIANADGRYPHLPRLRKELAEIFGVHQSQISRMMPPGAVRSATGSEVEKWLAASRLREVHPGFQASWLDWPPGHHPDDIHEARALIGLSGAARNWEVQGILDILRRSMASTEPKPA